MRSLLFILHSSLATRIFAQQKMAQYSFGKYGTITYEHIEFWTNNGKRTKIFYSYGKKPHNIDLQYIGILKFHGDSCFKVRFSNDYVLYIIPAGTRLKIADSAFENNKIFSWEYEGPIDGRGTFCSVCAVNDADALNLLRSAYLR